MTTKRKEFPLYNQEGIIIEIDQRIPGRNYLFHIGDGVYFLPQGSLEELAGGESAKFMKRLKEINPNIPTVVKVNLESIFQQAYAQEKLRETQRETL